MRVRRLTVFFWATCIIACLFILYVITDLNLPSIRPPIRELDDLQSKWSVFDSKLRHIESELNQHHALVGEIKSVVDQIVEKSNDYEPSMKRPKNVEILNKEIKVVADEPPQLAPVKLNEAQCPLTKRGIPQVDVQMLAMYDGIEFQDIDGGVWKQGWAVEYNDKQWNQRNKLKVFIVPHSHNDPGWLKTFENYYATQTRAIFSNMVEKVGERPGRKFIWAETSFLALWWTSDATAKEKALFANMLKAGQIEIVTGGWVMNDEANSHWLSIVQQLTTGHQWLIDNLDYIPKNAWAIDPFGHSSSQPYLLKLAGFDNMVIQRVHYRIKKELALNRQLEFKWRQLWDGTGATDMFTHMMPFYSYDVPHSCGPDPKICCQFDFKRLPGNGVTCPWGVPPRKITQKNIEERSFTIVDQWRKKAQLFRSNVVMFPLGDDFRYDSASEWDNQYHNYEMLIDFINANEDWNVEVQFGTLHDYFRALHSELRLTDFPSLSGDFFTYADRQQHYWSGYYTSRPFYKNMDRVVLNYVRAAEIITSQATMSNQVTSLVSIQLRDRVETARRSLALFQHHDGVTGTSKDEVREDYALKLHTAIKHCQSAIQQAAFYLLGQPQVSEQTQPDVYFDVDDIWRQHNEVPSRITIALDELAPSKKIVLYNSLTFKRKELVTIVVSSPYVELFGSEGTPVPCQVSPVVTGEKRLGIAANKYQVSFLAVVEPLALAVYTVTLRSSMTISSYTKYSRVRIFNADYWNVELPKVFQVEKSNSRLSEDIIVETANSTRVLVNKDGLIKAISSSNRDVHPVHMEFVRYTSDKHVDNNSGAYLFIPNGPAEVLLTDPFPEIVVMDGPIKATIHSALNAPEKAELVLSMLVYENPSLPQTEVEISHMLMIDPKVNDLEIALRFTTNIENEGFFTDLNGMQMIKRVHQGKLPMQANFFPLPAATYIEDRTNRLTILTSTPLGMAALRAGQLEIVQDRRLSRDDNRGINQGILDNVLTRHVFRLIIESYYSPCERSDPQHPSGQLSVGAHVSQQTLLHPLIVMQYSPREDVARPAYNPVKATLGVDVLLASYRSHLTGKSKDGTPITGFGMTFQRTYLDQCFGDKAVTNWYTLGDGNVKPSDITRNEKYSTAYSSSLTFVQVTNPLPGGVLTLCPMEIKSVFIKSLKT